MYIIAFNFVIFKNMINEINKQFDDYQKSLRVRKMKLKPYTKIERSSNNIDEVINELMNKEVTL